ncbi:MAG: Lrp/AsnC ligand binding domain-containing protein [Thermoplasmata archaeon]
MNQLKGESLLLVKVKPGEVRKAVRDLKRNEEIREANPVLGPYDVVASGAFENSRSLRNFVERVESKSFCLRCHARPSYEYWERQTDEQSQGIGWVLIRSNNPSGTLKGLRELENVRKLMWTAGEHNVAASFYVTSPRDWNRIVLEKIQAVAGVIGTLTLPSLPD